MENDSLIFQWFVNDSLLQKNDSTFVFTAYPEGIGVDSIKVVVLQKDTIITYQWQVVVIDPVSQLTFSPAGDTTIVEGDSLMLSANLSGLGDSIQRFYWKKNGKIDSSIQATEFKLQTDYNACGIDTISFQFFLNDSLYLHQWVITIQNRNRVPEIIHFTMPLDTTIVLNDSLYFKVSVTDPDQDSLYFVWSVNQNLDTSQVGTDYLYRPTNLSDIDTVRFQVSDGDTSVSFFWVVRLLDTLNHAPQIISISPDTIIHITQKDSITFKILCSDADGDSLNYNWWVNHQIDTTAHRSFYFYAGNVTSSVNDTVEVMVSDRDTTISFKWIVQINTLEQPFSVISFFPDHDSLFTDTDSLLFKIDNFPELTQFNWMINSRIDSSATDSYYSYFRQSHYGTDTVTVILLIKDETIKHSWFVFDSLAAEPDDSLVFDFFPESDTIFYSTGDSLLFKVHQVKGMERDFTVHWYVNQQHESSWEDSVFYFYPEEQVNHSDTISLAISMVDTTIFHYWIVQPNPQTTLPIPKLIFPIEGNHVTEFGSLLWENDSTFAAADSAGDCYYVVQLSEDSTFTTVISSDTCESTSIMLSQLQGFSSLDIGQMVYWRVKIFTSFNLFSKFSVCSLAFYYFPTFSIVDQFSGEVNNEGVLLSWKTSYLGNCKGFNLYRSDNPNRTFTRINDELITGKDRFTYLDKITLAGKEYYYKLEELTLDGRRKFHQTISIEVPRPDKYSLSQNYPNPFNATTSFKFQVPKATHVTIEVYNILGKRVRTLVNERKEAGYYTVFWDGIDNNGENVGSGVYFYQMSADQFHATHKMIVIR